MASRLVIYRGDDTGGAFGRALVFTMNVRDGIILEGCHGEWIFDGIVKTLAGPISDGEDREIFYSHNETQRMPLGVRFGTFRIVDAAGKVRTVDNAVPVEVTDILSRVYPGSSSRTFDIGYTVTWEQIALKPSVVSTINGQEPDENGNFVIEAGGTVKSATVNGGEKTLPTGDGNLALTVGAHDVGTLTEGEINDKINAFAAHYLTATAEGAAFANEAALTGATAFFYAGESATPTKNDYCIVLSDAQGKTSRWSFVGEWGEGGTWNRQYAINDTQFSEAQWNAINSGATAAKIAKIAEIDGKLGEENVGKTLSLKNTDGDETIVKPNSIETVSQYGDKTELAGGQVRLSLGDYTFNIYNGGFVVVAGDGKYRSFMLPTGREHIGQMSLATNVDIQLVPFASDWVVDGGAEGATYAATWEERSGYVGFRWKVTKSVGGSVVATVWQDGVWIDTKGFTVTVGGDTVTFSRTIYGWRLADNPQKLVALDELANALGMVENQPAPRMLLAAAPDAANDASGEAVRAQSRALFTVANPVLAETTAGAVEDAATLGADGKPASETMRALCSSANTILGETIGAKIAAAIGPVDDALDEALGEEVA